MRTRLIHRTASARWMMLGASLAALHCGGATNPAGTSQTPLATTVPATAQTTETQLITQKTEGTAKELRARADVAKRRGDLGDAVLALEALRSFAPSSSLDIELGDAYEALGERKNARARYEEGYEKTKASTPSEAIVALARLANLTAFDADWQRLKRAADELEALPGSDTIRLKLLAHGARGLANVELATTAEEEDRAMREIGKGLDLIEANHLDAAGRVAPAVAQVWFALGEVRRKRSERVTFDNVQSTSFIARLDARCDLLIAAQSSYTDAIRSEDPRWSAMAGVRVGEMYRRIHRDVLAVPNQKVKTKSQEQLVFGMMHMRYRVLLEKGADVMDRTIALSTTLNQTFKEPSVWLASAQATKVEIEEAIANEKKAIAEGPYNEKELQDALNILRDKAIAKTEREAEARRKREGR
jgi:tetratricopeptide (TPR) repeat protein